MVNVKVNLILIFIVLCVGCTKVYRVDFGHGEKVDRVKLGSDMLRKYDSYDLPQRKKIVLDDDVSCYDFEKEDFIACIGTKYCD